jgi:hypothetical protein
VVNSSINGCAQTSSISITVINFPNTTIGANSPLCEGSNLSLSASPVTGANYAWTGPNAFSSISQNPSIGSATPAASGTYTCLVAIGTCVSTYTTNVVVDAAVPSTITAAGPFCIADPAFDLTSPNEPGVWSGTGITNTTSGLFLPSTAGLGSTVVTFDSDSYCTSPSSLTIQVTSALSAAITPISPLCVNASAVQLQVANAGGTWSGNAVNSSGMVNPVVLGVGSFQATYTIAGSCGGSDMLTIQVVPLPQINFTS